MAGILIDTYPRIKALEDEVLAASYSTSTTNTAPVFSLTTGVENAPFDEFLVSGRTYTNRLADAVAGCESTDGWTASDIDLTTDSSNEFEGTNCLKLAISAGKTVGYIYRDILSSLDITKYYLFTAHVKNGNAATGVNLTVRAEGDKGSINYTANAGTSYQRQGIALQPSDFDGATQVYIFAVITGTETQYAYIDAILVTEISAAEFASATYVVSNIATQALMNAYPYILNTKGTGPQEIRSVGKNLINSDEIQFGTIDANGDITATNDSAVTGLVRVDELTEYTIAMKNAGYAINAAYGYYPNTKALGTGYFTGTWNTTFTTIANVGYVRYQCRKLDSATMGSDDLAAIKVAWQLEKGASSTTYEAYKESVSYTPELNSVPAIADTYDTKTGLHTTNTAIDSDVSGAQFASLDKTTYTLVDVIKTTAFSSAKAGTAAADGMTRVYSSAGLELSEVAVASIDSTASIGKYYYHTDKTVWWIVAADTYADIAAARTGLGTCAVRYQLATPTYETIVQPPLQSFENGSVTAIHKVRDTCLYDAAGDGFTITDSTYPISSLARVYKQSGDTITDIAISTCTVAAGGLTFTSTALSTGDTVVAIFDGLFSNSTVPSVTHSEATDLRAMAEATANGMAALGTVVDNNIVYQNAVNLEFDARITALEGA